MNNDGYCTICQKVIEHCVCCEACIKGDSRCCDPRRIDADHRDYDGNYDEYYEGL